MSLLSIVARVALVVTLAALTTPTQAAAQGSDASLVPPPPALTPAVDAPAAPRSIPSAEASVAGIRLQVAGDAPPPPVLAPSAGGRGQALAIVGGAAFLGGLLIGGDAGTAIAIGGLAVGVYGLWLWLN